MWLPMGKMKHVHERMEDMYSFVHCPTDYQTLSKPILDSTVSDGLPIIFFRKSMSYAETERGQH